MREIINVLWLGNKIEVLCNPPKEIRLFYNPKQFLPKDKMYDLVILDRTPSEKELKILYEKTKAYTVYASNNVKASKEFNHFYIQKAVQKIEPEHICQFIENDARNFFPGSYGEKFNSKNIGIAQGFEGKVKWNANYSVVLEGEYGDDFQQIVFWRNNIPIEQGQALDIWLEYKKDPTVEIQLSVTHFVSGSLADVDQKWTFDEEQLKETVIVDNKCGYGPLFFSLSAKGKGKLEVIALHDRYSRRGYGAFIPGGKCWVSSEREEVFTYFDPGDLKPPLHIYFSGYKTKQGFEGYNLMKRMGSPFLLVAEGRLEGGGFYIGSSEYEKIIVDTIEQYRNHLGFTKKELIFSGLSMGTYGAMYYGIDFSPYAILLGKPLVSLGDVAENERILRPEVFPTSLDVMKYNEGELSERAQRRLNERIWKKAKNVRWNKTKFIISYMIEDDYDDKGYETLISRLDTKQVKIYGKGIHGRHNDDTFGIVDWYCSQLSTILQKDFEREDKKH